VIVILNGSVGVGKTSVSWTLNESFDRSVMLDGDYLGAVHPFAISTTRTSPICTKQVVAQPKPIS
jgi:2-phosphoglycerate kinase